MTPGDLGRLILRLVIGLTFAAHGAPEVRGLLMAVGVLGALVGLAIPRVRPVERPAAAGPR
jgi:uncharacterized membrane protein YphA (DoxX/SURF4 family)